MKATALLGILVLVMLAGCGGSSDDTASSDEREIRALYDRFSAAAEAKDLDAIMAAYVPDESLVAFDSFLPRRYVGAAAYRKAYEAFFAAFPGPLKTSGHADISITTAGTLAYAHGTDRWVATGSDGKPLEVVFRFTDVLRKIDGKWLIVHEHLSFPVDAVTGQADFLSKP